MYLIALKQQVSLPAAFKEFPAAMYVCLCLLQTSSDVGGNGCCRCPRAPLHIDHMYAFCVAYCAFAVQASTSSTFGEILSCTCTTNRAT